MSNTTCDQQKDAGGVDETLVHSINNCTVSVHGAFRSAQPLFVFQ